jgi:hypothetical protein
MSRNTIMPYSKNNEPPLQKPTGYNAVHGNQLFLGCENNVQHINMMYG